MDDFQQKFDKAILDYASKNQYGVSRIPYHTHNGTDSPLVHPTSSDINARSYGTGVTSIVTGTPTKLTLQSNSFNNGVTWDSTNNRLQIITAGQYLITALVTYTNTTDAKGYQTLVYKNGGEIMAANMMASAAGGAVSPVSTDIQTLATNDYLELYTFHNAGVNQTVGSTTEQTYLAIAKV